ncbi:DUF397 domain-containing protein [Actinomadura harenae]|uniref:DUF397 domain-containing protein n=1 Tax=Actinomadura harenae TaxID=2483351 RepID=A0A3M2LYI9_9ACTN|nr:DUF397 domain-containing protein [Actinomadura harenae]RMI42216.1 DUF397 domain-containing protein [Actinomadura harenae]
MNRTPASPASSTESPDGSRDAPCRDLGAARWTTSSHSGSGDQCVEVAALPGARHAVRDSKDPRGPALLLAPAEWRAMLDRVASL